MSDHATIVFVGMDMGGTKTSVVYQKASPHGAALNEFTMQGANYNRVGAPQVLGLIAASLVRIQQELNEPCVFKCVAGVAGAGRPETIDRLQGGFEEIKISSSDQFLAFSDAQVALEAAFSGKSGAIVIAGTGSGVIGKNDEGKLVRAGGWGPRLGDIASGEQIGRRALRAVARSVDGGPSTALTQKFSEELGFSDRATIVEAVYDNNLNLSSLAPYVLDAAERNDLIAREILRSEAEELAEEARWVLDQMDDTRVALIGGLVQNKTFRLILEDALKDEIPDVVITEPDNPPGVGALNMAQHFWPATL